MICIALAMVALPAALWWLNAAAKAGENERRARELEEDRIAGLRKAYEATSWRMDPGANAAAEAARARVEEAERRYYLTYGEYP